MFFFWQMQPKVDTLAAGPECFPHLALLLLFLFQQVVGVQ
jgi:hypothetical protein